MLSRVLFCEKLSQNGEITLSFTDIGKSCHTRDLYVANMSFNTFRENEILAKISKFTVPEGPLSYA